MNEFNNEISQRLFFKKVREDLESGLESGVAGTSTFFINGVRYSGSYDKEELLNAIKGHVVV